MVVAQSDVQELWQGLIFLTIDFVDVLFEPIHTSNVGDIHIEYRKLLAGVVIKDFWHREVDNLCRSRARERLVFINLGKLKSFTIVSEANIIPTQMFPHRSVLEIVLGYLASVRTKTDQASLGIVIGSEIPAGVVNS